MPEQDIINITRLDVHHLTDEVFVLLKGNAVLIAASIVDGYVDFKMELMKPNITYNIPKGTWHNIAMTKGCETLIVEKSNTHISDFEFYPLNETKLEELRSRVNELLNSAIKATLTKQ